MSDERGPEQKRDRSGDYITQKIVGRRDTGRRILLLILKAALSGIVFAAAAAAAAVLLFPAVKEHLGIGTESGREAVRVERDEAGMTGTSSPETTAAETEAGTENGSTAETAETETAAAQKQPAEAPEDAVKRVLSDYKMTADDVLRISNAMQRAADAADGSIASVTRVTEEKDWFDNDLKTSGINSGILVARTGSELLVLTTASAVNGADALTVTFSGEASAEASVLQTDTPAGLAVLSVALTQENRKKLKDIKPVELGNSYLMRRGDIVMALGAPCGTIHSADYGLVTSVTSGVSVADGTETVSYTDSHGTVNAGTWILNPRGELLGWVAEDPAETKSGETAVIGISEYKGILEHMMNGEKIPWLGITGKTVTPEMILDGMPEGLYVTEVVRKGPAYSAGIQPGDILVSADGREIRTMRDYEKVLEEITAGETVRLTVRRNGREDYASLEFDAEVGTR